MYKNTNSNSLSRVSLTPIRFNNTIIQFSSSILSKLRSSTRTITRSITRRLRNLTNRLHIKRLHTSRRPHIITNSINCLTSRFTIITTSLRHPLTRITIKISSLHMTNRRIMALIRQRNRTLRRNTITILITTSFRPITNSNTHLRRVVLRYSSP